MRVVVLGASGLLGRSVGDELLAHGHDVVGVSRSGGASARLSAAGTVVRADLTTATDAELDALLAGADGVVHGLGPDDRSPLPVPVAATLERLLVGPTVRVAAAARRQGVPHVVVLGSYFSTFDRRHPEWGLGRRHPYVRARGDQAAGAEAAAAAGTVSVLEIPFVFGAVPGVEPLWKAVLFDRLRRGPVAATLRGSTAAVTNTDVAHAVRAILDGTVPPGRHPLAVDNLTHRHLTQVVLAELGRDPRVVAVPGAVVTAGMVAAAARERLRGRGPGLAPRHLFADLLARDLQLDPQEHGAALGLVPRSVDDAIRESVRAAYGPPPPPPPSPPP